MCREIDVGLLRRLLRYDPETGRLFWLSRSTDSCAANRVASWNARFSNREAFTADHGNGYRSGGLFGRIYRAHRVAWAIHYGEWPSMWVDHINGNRSDNRIANLRLASASQNSRNTRSAKGSSSQFLGVHRDNSKAKWKAKIRIDGRDKHLGYFDIEEDAARAYDAAALASFGDFARPNFNTAT